MATNIFRKAKGLGYYPKAPLIKDIIGRCFVSQLTRTLALVLGGGIPLVPALEIIYNSVTNPILAIKIKKAAAKVNEGTSLASAFESEGAMERACQIR